ncbi:MAG TPA: carboxypeptidase regulatory-like domain-containing protein, partial [Terriglobales bacterium]
MKDLTQTLRAFFLTLVFVNLTLAQSNTGGIRGTVFDPNGAVVSGATVVVTNVGTGRSVRVTTSPTGAFGVSNLDPVVYRVEVENSGFKKMVVETVKVDTASVATVNVTLEPGTVATEIQVTAQSPILNTESGTTGQTITERQMQDLPLVNRSVLDLALTAPNVTGVAGSEDPGVTSGFPVPGFNLSLNGGRPGSTIMLADGVNNTGVGVAREVVSFTPETVQEFTVQTSAYSAEFGSTGGGVINVTTKSGTNSLNGTLLWYTRNPFTNAKAWTAGSQHPLNNLRYNQFSATVGGPVVIPKIYNGRDKTFFFFAAEPRYRRDFLVQDTLLPDAKMRSGDFSNITRTSSGWLPTNVATQFGLTSVGPSTIFQQFNLVNGQWKPAATITPFPGNVIPQTMLDPTALKALQFMPAAGSYFTDANGLVKNYVVNRFVKQDEVRYTTRIDQNLGSKDSINFRYTYVPAVGSKGFGSDVNGNGASYSYSRQAVIGETHLFSSTLLNDLHLDYTRGTFSDDYSPEFSVKTGRNLATELGLPSLTHGGMPLFQFSTDSNGYDAFTNIGSATSTNNYNVEERYNLVEKVSWTHGAMNWKFGVDLTHALLNVIPFFGASGGRWDFRVAQTSSVFGSTAVGNGGNSFASYLLGIPNVILQRPVLIPYYYRWNSAAAFIQNDWKARPNLTLNLGLRYSLQLPRTEKNNLQGEFLPNLAQSFPISPITLPGTNQVLTSILVPPFAYAGHGGSKYLVPIERYDFEPRFGFAWSPHLFGRNNFVVRGGYGLSHAPITGNNRLPNPDFGATNNVSTNTGGSTGTVDPTSAIRLSSNPPLLNPGLTAAQALNIPANGLVYLGSLAIPGFAVPENTHIPYVQNWNLSLSYEVARNTVVEAAYVGAKGTHLYLPLININPRDFNLINAMENAVVRGSNSTTLITPDTTISDPLGRKDLLGSTLSVPIGSLASKFVGFNALSTSINGEGSSIYHGTYVSLLRRVSNGLLFTANYTYSKSIDDASDASPDKFVLTTGTINGGQVTFGAPLSIDRSESAYDIPHALSATYIWDLPFGTHRAFMQNAWAPVRWALGDWTTSGVFRLQSEYPFLPVINDANGLSGSLTHTVRPDIVPGVPLINPNYSRSCITLTTCEPYVNPAAFMRPVKGQLGDASRTLAIRGPMQRFFDASIRKDFPLPGPEGRRRLQFRMDLLNAFNHPNFQLNSGTLVNGAASNDFMGAPNEGTVSFNSAGTATFTA